VPTSCDAATNPLYVCPTIGITCIPFDNSVVPTNYPK
jgi:hypothetical protein